MRIRDSCELFKVVRDNLNRQKQNVMGRNAKQKVDNVSICHGFLYLSLIPNTLIIMLNFLWFVVFVYKRQPRLVELGPDIGPHDCSSLILIYGHETCDGVFFSFFFSKSRTALLRKKIVARIS